MHCTSCTCAHAIDISFNNDDDDGDDDDDGGGGDPYDNK